MTTTDVLRIAPEISLPLDAATRRLAILAQSGAGKSNTAVKLAEEMYRVGIPWVAIDPKGDWWGMRSDHRGTGPGLPIPILGGLHGDIPLDPHGGRAVADLVVDQRVTVILDVSEFESNEQMWRFLLDFGTQLLRRKAANRWPLHLFLDEADQYMPQSAREGGSLPRCLGVWLRAVTKGRQRGLGSTLISQRSATVHKDALYMAEAMFAMRTVGPRNKGDRPTISGWFDEHAIDGKSLIDVLPTLANGEALVASPVWLGITQPTRIQMYQRQTFDSGATPSMEDAGAPVATLADIDLGALAERMQETIEIARANDPEVLRAEVARLKRELDDATANGRRLGSEATAEAYAANEAQLLAAAGVERDDLRRIIDDYGRLFGSTLGLLDDVAEAASGAARGTRAALSGIAPLRMVSVPNHGPGEPVTWKISKIGTCCPHAFEEHDAASWRCINEGCACPGWGIDRALERSTADFNDRHERARVAESADARAPTEYEAGFADVVEFGREFERMGKPSEGVFDPEKVGPPLVSTVFHADGSMTHGGTLVAPLVLKAGARRMLAVLAAFGDHGLTREQLGTLASVQSTGGTFSTYLSDLRQAQYITEREGRVRPTLGGLDAADTSMAIPRTTAGLVEAYGGKLKGGARRMLDTLVRRHPSWLTREELGYAANVQSTGGTFSTYLSALRRNGLIEEDGPRVRAGPALYLFEEAR